MSVDSIPSRDATMQGQLTQPTLPEYVVKRLFKTHRKVDHNTMIQS